MSVLNAIAPPINHCRAGTQIKAGFYSWSLLLVSSCVWALGASVAERAPESHTTASPRLIPPPGAGTGKPATRFGDSVSRNAEGGEFDQRELSALNLLGIQYARGQGVKKNPALAKRFFLRSAIQGYTPAMANLGTLYEIGAKRHSDLQNARGQGVKKNPALAKRFFLRSAIQGYTPAMANLGTLYEIGAKRHSDL